MTDPILNSGSDPSLVWNALNSLAAVGAAALSGWALWRQRVPKPHWESLDPVRIDSQQGVTDGPSSTWYRKDVHTWYLRAQQHGPGEAEQVRVSFHTPNGPWLELNIVPRVPRGEELTVPVWDGMQLPEGRYGLKLVYRCLPDTTKERTWVSKVDYKA